MSDGTAPAPVAGDQCPPLKAGSCLDQGRKPGNQDRLGYRLPSEPLLTTKGAVFALADGISSSSFSHIASDLAIRGFIDDYYSTSDAWSPGHGGCQVLETLHSWLQTQSQRFAPTEPDKGYVCTFSTLMLVGARAWLIHVGDSRIYRIRGSSVEQLTEDHRRNGCLSQALGMPGPLNPDVHSLPLAAGDGFMLASDGLFDFIDTATLPALLAYPDLDQAAAELVARALDNGSEDNLSVVLVKVGQPGNQLAQDYPLPVPPVLATGDDFDGFVIERELHHSSRSHLYLARDRDTGLHWVLKTPSTDQQDQPGYLDRLIREEWLLRRVSSPHLVRAAWPGRQRGYQYIAMEYIEGQSLAQWQRDNPAPGLDRVRDIISQLARALQALHRAEILHQDLRPENVLIDQAGRVRLIDLGAARVSGLPDPSAPPVPGTLLFAAPEYFVGGYISTQSDLYSLAVLAYFLLTGRFPYGNSVSRAHTLAAQRKLTYRSVLDDSRPIPLWLDMSLKKALHPDPRHRYQDLSEFVAALHHPDSGLALLQKPPLMERHPVRFWQGVSALLLLALLVVAAL